MPVELFREVPTTRRSGVSVLEHLAFSLALSGFIVGMFALAFAWSWM